MSNSQEWLNGFAVGTAQTWICVLPVLNADSGNRPETIPVVTKQPNSSECGIDVHNYAWTLFLRLAQLESLNQPPPHEGSRAVWAIEKKNSWSLRLHAEIFQLHFWFETLLLLVPGWRPAVRVVAVSSVIRPFCVKPARMRSSVWGVSGPRNIKQGVSFLNWLIGAWILQFVKKKRNEQKQVLVQIDIQELVKRMLPNSWFALAIFLSLFFESLFLFLDTETMISRLRQQRVFSCFRHWGAAKGTTSQILRHPNIGSTPLRLILQWHRNPEVSCA